MHLIVLATVVVHELQHLFRVGLQDVSLAVMPCHKLSADDRSMGLSSTLRPP